MAKTFKRVCAECDREFEAKTRSATFCCTEHRKDYHNRAQVVGREMYHLVMSMRYARAEANEQGAWTLLCKLAEDAHNRQNNGTRRFDSAKEVLYRNPHLHSVVVCRNYRAGR